VLVVVVVVSKVVVVDETKDAVVVTVLVCMHIRRHSGLGKKKFTRELGAK
jgi:hypothetical protein